MGDLTSIRHIHMVGVGGAGMSALAKVLAQMGIQISGSDLKRSPAVDLLEQLGIETWVGSRPERITGADVVVASSAVPDRDPELTHAREHAISIWRRPRLLAALTSLKPAIGATGTHGKTSTTAMMITAARGIGLDPTFVVGGELIELRTNGHLGDDDLFIIEADEAFGTFLHLNLKGLVVTNVESEHLDHYGTVFEMEDAFAEVVRGVDGPVVVGVDDPGSRRLAERTERPTYGTSSDADWRIVDIVERHTDVGFRIVGRDLDLPVSVSSPGIHSARNAAGALLLLSELGYDIEQAASALADFGGVQRRFEVRGHVDGVTIIDDYAHHPTEVAATVRTAMQGGWNKVWAVFQPHLYSRTAQFHREFGQAFAGCDEVVITDVFGAREAPQPGITGALVADAARTLTSANVSYVPHRHQLAEFLVERAQAGDLVLTMGAGDITLVADELSPLLAERESG